MQKAEQLDNLLSLIEDVVLNNGGKPYTDELFVELKVSFLDCTNSFLFVSLWRRKAYAQYYVYSLIERSHETSRSRCRGKVFGKIFQQEIYELKEQMHKSHEEQMKKIIMMVLVFFMLFVLFVLVYLVSRAT